MPTGREKRLMKEFQLMKTLRAPYSLIDFRCGVLSSEEGAEFLKSETSLKVIREGTLSFLTVEEFEKQYPNQAPEKYIVLYQCTGLQKTPQGEIIENNEHAMEVVFSWDFPSRPPLFIWITPIYHPNFRNPYVCTQGRPFAVGVTLDKIVQMIGEMIQYRIFDVSDYLDFEAATWANENLQRFPVDKRDLLDRREVVGKRLQREIPLVQLVEGEIIKMSKPDDLIELVDEP